MVSLILCCNQKQTTIKNYFKLFKTRGIITLTFTFIVILNIRKNLLKIRHYWV